MPRQITVWKAETSGEVFDTEQEARLAEAFDRFLVELLDDIDSDEIYEGSNAAAALRRTLFRRASGEALAEEILRHRAPYKLAKPDQDPGGPGTAGGAPKGAPEQKAAVLGDAGIRSSG